MGIRIKELAAEDRPREKMQMNGAKALSDAELIGILLGSGNTEESAVALAQRMLKDADNDLSKIAKWSAHEFMQYHGVGEAKAITLCASMELARRRGAIKPQDLNAIRGSSDVYHMMRSRAMDLPVEKFWVIHLNRAHLVQDITELSTGGVSQTIVDMKVLFKEALIKLSSSIILCHNHPSGNLQPSTSDIALTKRAKEAANLFNISLLDHVIIADSGYFSFSDEGLL